MTEGRMRRVVYLVLVVLLALASFGLGYMSRRPSSLERHAALTVFSWILADFFGDYVLLTMLNEGKTDRARLYLNMKLDGHALTASNLLECGPTGQDRISAENLLWRIKEHRKKHPFVRKEADPKIEAAVQEALSKAVNHVGGE